MQVKATTVLVPPDSLGEERFTLDREESHHLVRVIRAAVGDIFRAIDGCGKQVTAKITSIKNGQVTAEIIETRQGVNEFAVDIALFCGLCRPTKADLIVEKATELGVASIGFCISEKCYLKERRFFSDDRRLNRWRSIARSAAKQSLRSVVPQISPLLELDSMLALAERYHKKVIADQSRGKPPVINLFEPVPDSIFLLVGPESGFSDAEVTRIIAAGFEAVSLGRRRLRAETAAISLLSIIGAMLEPK